MILLQKKPRGFQLIKMKEQKFEKVIKWGQEPNSLGTILGLIIFCLAMANGYYGWDMGTEEEMEARGISRSFVFVLTLNSILIFVWSLTILGEHLGKDRKVYWRKVK